MKSLIEKIEYCIQHSEEEAELEKLFLPSEWDVLSAMKDYKLCLYNIESKFSEDEPDTRSGIILKELESLEEEKETALYLKEKIILQLDILLKKGSVEAWCEILVWYQFVIVKLEKRFWEFIILKILLCIFTGEAKKGQPVSVLQFHSMGGLIDGYFKTVFLLRRIEYDMEPVEDFKKFAVEHKFSSLYVHGIIAAAQIYDKDKVKQTIESRWKSDIK